MDSARGATLGEANRSSGLTAGVSVGAVLGSVPGRLALVLTILLLIGQALPATKFFSNAAHYLPLHIVLEFVAISVTGMVAGLAWNLRERTPNSQAVVLSAGFLAVFWLDILHTLSFAGMPELVTPSDPEKAINFWLAGRAVAAATVLFIALSRPMDWSRQAAWRLLAAAAGLTGLVAWVGLAQREWLPRTFVPGEGLTTLKIAIEYVLAAAYGLAAILLYRSAARERNPDRLWLAAAAWVLGLAEMFFTLYTDVTDLFNLLGHVYKALAYMLVYRALFVSGVLLPYRELDAERSRLRESEQHFRTLANSGSALIWTSGTDKLCNYFNEPWLNYTGRRLEQELGNGWAENVHPDDLERCLEIYDAHFERRQPFSMEYRLRRADGEYGWFVDQGAPRFDSQNNFLGYIGFCYDVTERKQTEAAIQEHEVLLRTLSDNLPGGVVYQVDTGLDGKERRFTYLSSGVETLHGVTVAEGLANPMVLYGQIPEDERAALAEEEAAAIAGMEPFSAEIRTLHPSGETRWSLTRSAPRRAANGHLVWDGIELDITELKKAELALKVSEHRFRDLVDSTDGIVWEADAQTFRFTFVSQKAEQLLGFPVEDWYKPGFWVDHLHPEDRDWAPNHCASCTGRIEPHDFEYRFIARDGRTVWLHDIVTVVAENGEPRWLRGIMIDVSERKQAEQELDRYRNQLEALVEERTAELTVAKEAAEAANVAKTAFLANMSHEIRTPLGAITGMARLIRRGGLSAEQANHLNKLEAAGEHLLNTINSILDLSKIEAGKLQLEASPVRLERIVGNVVSILHDRVQAKHLRVVIESGDLPPNLVGDPVRLQQALLNYAANAVKFTDRGTITLRSSVLEETEDSAHVRLEVQDTGIGIGADVLARLFAAFEQADNSMTRKYGGTGLGLAITRRLAELMGGTAGAESTPGAGSTFWFTARLKKAASTTSASGGEDHLDAEAILKHAFAGKRILVAEDEPINREIAQIQLEDVGMQVDTAEDGVEAVALAGRNRYDLILMDMQMPRMNGLEATREIRKLSSDVHVPILAMTANAFSEDKAQCFEAGMDDFISKPVKVEALYGTLLKWLSRGK